MKNKEQAMDQHSQTKIPDWLYQGTEEDDFLRGRTPNQSQDMWEEEE